MVEEQPKSSRPNRRPKLRQLFRPAHPEQLIEGNGKKYFLHLLRPEDLKVRGTPHKKAQLVIEAYPVLLSNEWLEELFCPDAARATGARSPKLIGWCTAYAELRGNYGNRWRTWIRCSPTPA
jgi:hypothetical protein